MRLPVAALVCAFCAFAPIVASGHRPRVAGRNDAPKEVAITVSARCRPAGGADVRVDPDPVLLHPNDEATWELDSAATAESMRVYPKVADEWPFPDSPHRGKRGAPARARRMKAGQAGRAFLYNVELTCIRPGGLPDTVVFDPEMIIRKR